MPSASPPHLRLRVFLASPGDVEEERKAARELMEIVLPKDAFLPNPVSFDVVAWDHPAASTPMPAQITPQEAVIRYKTRPAECDIVLVILRARIGTVLDVSRLKKPDGSPYLSGTEWEFEDAWNATPRPEIMIYRCANPPSVPLNDPQRKDKQAQYDALETFLSRFKNPDGSWNGGINDFTDTADFRKQLETYLKQIIRTRAPCLTTAPQGTAAAPSEKPPRPVLLPYPTLGPLFKGRDTFLTRLHATLRTGNAAAINGMGGIGKTRTAVEYAWAHRDDHTATALLDAETQDRLQTSLAALAAPLRLPAQSAPEEAIRFEAVLDWLNSNPGSLLILDNIDSAAALTAAHRLLGRLSGGQVILTSRLTMFPTGIYRLDLDLLMPEAATEFLQDATPARPQTPNRPAC